MRRVRRAMSAQDARGPEDMRASTTSRRFTRVPACGAMADRLEYDATGLLCPLPVLRANRKMRELDAGGQIGRAHV